MLNNNNKTLRTEEEERPLRDNIYSYYYNKLNPMRLIKKKCGLNVNCKFRKSGKLITRRQERHRS
jgi:hypothetical protein